jgi:hypothetical protein
VAAANIFVPEVDVGQGVAHHSCRAKDVLGMWPLGKRSSPFQTLMPTARMSASPFPLGKTPLRIRYWSR